MNKLINEPSRIIASLYLFICLLTLLPFSTYAISVTEKNVLYVAMYFVDYPDGSKGIRMMIVFDFNETAGLPINMSSPALEKLQQAEYSVSTEVLKSFSLFLASYVSTTPELANNYTDEVCKEFLKAFDLNLSVVDRDYQINNQTGTIQVSRKLEAAPYDIPTTEKFLKYKPSTGFGKLITKDVLSKYIPGTGTTRMDISWSLNKDRGEFCWRLKIILSSVDIWLTGNEKDRDIELNLNELLNNTGVITLDQSEIIISIENQYEFRTKTYTLNITSISPPGYIREDEMRRVPTTIIAYLPSNVDSVQNVIVRMKLNKMTNDFNWASIIAVVAIAGIMCIILIRRKKRHRR